MSQTEWGHTAYTRPDLWLTSTGPQAVLVYHFNGPHPCNYMDHYSFIDPEGMKG